MIAVSFFSDAIDGFLARRYKVATKIGSTLDSIGDDLTIIAAISGMIFFKNDFFREQFSIFILLFILYFLQTVLALFRYRKLSSFHTYAAKIAAILQGVFFLLLFFLETPFYLLFYISAVIMALDLLEEIILVIILPDWVTDVKGLYWVLKKRNSK